MLSVMQPEACLSVHCSDFKFVQVTSCRFLHFKTANVVKKILSIQWFPLGLSVDPKQEFVCFTLGQLGCIMGKERCIETSKQTLTYKQKPSQSSCNQ